MARGILTVAQQKGGVGKTTIAAQLAVAWASAGRSVAVVDVDPQGTMTAWYGLREEWLGPDHTGLTFERLDFRRLAPVADRLARDHDLVVIDCPPHAEADTRSAMRVADLVLVPVQPTPVDAWATRPTVDLALRAGARVMLVLNRVPARSRLNAEIEADLRGLGVPIARTKVGNRVALAAAASAGLGVTESEPSSRAQILSITKRE